MVLNNLYIYLIARINSKKKQKTKEDVHVLLQLCLTLRVYIKYYITLIGYTPHLILTCHIDLPLVFKSDCLLKFLINEG